MADDPKGRAIEVSAAAPREPFLPLARLHWAAMGAVLGEGLFAETDRVEDDVSAGRALIARVGHRIVGYLAWGEPGDGTGLSEELTRARGWASAPELATAALRAWLETERTKLARGRVVVDFPAERRGGRPTSLAAEGVVLRALVVSQRWPGSGVAAALLAAWIERMEAQGAEALHVRGPERTLPAADLQRLGFTLILRLGPLLADGGVTAYWSRALGPTDQPESARAEQGDH